MNEVMLSVLVPVFNHEQYIEKALDSIFMQKTSYSYEVLVGEDCSTDNTREVLKKYECQYPEKLKVFYRKQNLSHSRYNNIVDLRKRAQGKYLITLEGDDFWISNNKIQRQLEFLETHPEYIAVAHNCIVVGRDGKPNGEHYPECKRHHYSFGDYLMETFPGQTASVMYRNFEKNNLVDKSILEKNLIPGDRLLYFALILNGRIYCIQEAMSAYRHVTQGGTSFSATYKYSFTKEEYWHRQLLEYAQQQKCYKAVFVAEILYLSKIIHGWRHKYINFRDFKSFLQYSHTWYLSIWGWLFRYLLLRLLYSK